jgi:hypothetical protein
MGSELENTNGIYIVMDEAAYSHYGLAHYINAEL